MRFKDSMPPADVVPGSVEAKIEMAQRGELPLWQASEQGEKRLVMEAIAAVKSMGNKGAVPAPGSGGTAAPRARENSVEEKESPVLKVVTASEKVEQESREKVERIAKVMDDYVRSSQRSLKIQVDSRTGKTIVRVISKEDGRTIREIPPEQVLNLAARMEEMMGFLFDEKV